MASILLNRQAYHMCESSTRGPIRGRWLEWLESAPLTCLSMTDNDKMVGPISGTPIAEFGKTLSFGKISHIFQHIGE